MNVLTDRIMNSIDVQLADNTGEVDLSLLADSVGHAVTDMEFGLALDEARARFVRERQIVFERFHVDGKKAHQKIRVADHKGRLKKVSQRISKARKQLFKGADAANAAMANATSEQEQKEVQRRVERSKRVSTISEVIEQRRREV